MNEAEKVEIIVVESDDGRWEGRGREEEEEVSDNGATNVVVGAELKWEEEGELEEEGEGEGRVIGNKTGVVWLDVIVIEKLIKGEKRKGPNGFPKESNQKMIRLLLY